MSELAQRAVAALFVAIAVAWLAVTSAPGVVLEMPMRPVMGARSPATLGGTASGLLLYVEDVDARFAQALAAGATEKRPLQNQFYGDRSGTLTDPSGHVWTLATHVEDVTPEECHRRFEALLKSQGAAA